MSEPRANSWMPPRRREIFGWCCFDFANSAFTTIIITVVGAPYFMAAIAEGDPRGPGWWGTALAASQAAVIVLSPLLGALADVRAAKKRFLMISALVCGTATLALYFAGPGDVMLALGLVIVANLAFSLGENFCASFLPEISRSDNVGRISSYGWAFGYLGGLLSLVLALVIIKSGEGRVAWTLVMTGVFFLVGSLPTLLLRERARPRSLAPGETWVGLGWRQLVRMRQELPQHRSLGIFFLALTLYLAGLAAVVAFAGAYAMTELGMTQSEVIALFAVLQLAGIAGAYGFGVLQDRIGAKPALGWSLVLWIIVCGWAALCTTKREFYVIGVLAGAAMGSLQSSGRAVVALLSPAGRSGEFFGYWGFFGKLAAVIGQMVFGWVASAGGYRLAIACNAGFFVAGLLIVLCLRIDRHRDDAHPIAA
ncbi:MAG: MFS transporter [Opitutaceae bacterium]|nr:MFS transporter [Opitutaceae bacterium]